MKKIFKPEKNSSFVASFSLTLIIIYFLSFLVGVKKDIDWSNPVLLATQLFLAFVFFIFSNRGSLEIENNILSRKRFFKLWSVNILDIKYVMQGNMLGGRLRGGYYNLDGFSFQTTDGNFYQFPENLMNPTKLWETLLSINPSINFISDTETFRDHLGWKNGSGRKLNVLMLFIALALGFVFTILDGLK